MSFGGVRKMKYQKGFHAIHKPVNLKVKFSKSYFENIHYQMKNIYNP